MEIIAYEMKLNKSISDAPDILCIPSQKPYFEEYMRIYNECFYDMRKALDIEPHHFLCDYEQIVDKVEDIYLLVDKEVIIGSVACYGNEIDDLIVNQKFQRQGYGKLLLLWAIWHIRERNNEPITLHVAAWNQKAIMLYEKCGFEIVKSEKVR
ncbi:MAG: GNAT family N-acetyltransferase [Lachnospiraceae bacterium]|nr:GNAT family N-acetyltransferase [Lachnospiraceae bacterium]